MQDNRRRITPFSGLMMKKKEKKKREKNLVRKDGSRAVNPLAVEAPRIVPGLNLFQDEKFVCIIRFSQLSWCIMQRSLVSIDVQVPKRKASLQLPRIFLSLTMFAYRNVPAADSSDFSATMASITKLVEGKTFFVVPLERIRNGQYPESNTRSS